MYGFFLTSGVRLAVGVAIVVLGLFFVSMPDGEVGYVFIAIGGFMAIQGYVTWKHPHSIAGRVLNGIALAVFLLLLAARLLVVLNRR